MKKLAAISMLLICVACSRDREGTTPIETSDTAATSGASATAAPRPPDDGSMIPTHTGVTSPDEGTAGAPLTTTIPTNPATEPPPDTAPAPTAQIAAGQPIFQSKCASCHGAAGRTAIGNVTLASAATQAKSDAELARTVRESPQHRRLGLNDEQVNTVVSYVKALK
jgi:mono/diheme cytochrome c family protein